MILPALMGKKDLMEWYMLASKWRRVVAPAVTVLLLVDCSNSLSRSQLQAQDSLQRLHVAGQREIECRAVAARNPHYQILRQDMPLTNFAAITVSEMSNQNFATKDEILALDSWTSDINACLEPFIQETDATIPSIGPIIEASWNDENVVFVKLAHHQMKWGEAAMSLRTAKIKQRSDLIDRADKVSEELSRIELARYNRRTAVITSVLGALP